MEKLADALQFAVAGTRIQLGKGYPGKARGRGKVSRQAQSAHPAAVRPQSKTGSKSIVRLPAGKSHVVVQQKQLLFKRRVIGQNSHRVFVDMQAVCHRFHRDRSGSVSNDPVKLGAGERFAERCVGQIDAGQRFPGVANRCALSQNPWDKLKLGHIFPAGNNLPVHGISYKI